jgi:hypothetical protein
LAPVVRSPVRFALPDHAGHGSCPGQSQSTGIERGASSRGIEPARGIPTRARGSVDSPTWTTRTPARHHRPRTLELDDAQTAFAIRDETLGNMLTSRHPCVTHHSHANLLAPDPPITVRARSGHKLANR